MGPFEIRNYSGLGGFQNVDTYGNGILDDLGPVQILEYSCGNTVHAVFIGVNLPFLLRGTLYHVQSN